MLMLNTMEGGTATLENEYLSPPATRSKYGVSERSLPWLQTIE